MDEYPIYKPFNKVQTYAGLQGKYWGKVFLVAAIGAALFLFLGMFKTTIDDELSITDKNIYLSTYSEALKTYKTVNQQIEFQESKIQNITPEQQQEIKSAVIGTLTETQLEQYNLALEKRMTIETTENDLSAMVPKTKKVETEVFPNIPRALILIVVPTGFTIAWHLDLRGFTLCSEFKRYNKFRKRKALKVSKKSKYLGYTN